MRTVLTAGALAAVLVVPLAGDAGAKSLSTVITVSVTVTDECSATTSWRVNRITETCSDGTSATGLRAIAHAPHASAMVEPLVTIDPRTGSKTIEF